MKLRDYQQRAVDEVRSVLSSGKRKPVMVLPTGAGKSIIFAEIINRAVEKGNKVLWLVHRRNLVHQMRDTLNEFGLNPGTIMAGEEPDTDAQVQIGTIQTYSRRVKLDNPAWHQWCDRADMLMIDEAHRSVSQSYQTVINGYADKYIIGCTATPMRADQRGLGEVYDSLVDVVGVKDLTEQGYLSPARYFAPSEPDLAKVKVAMGDYQVKSLGQTMNTPKLVGDVIENWLSLAEDRQTLVFAVNVAHSKSLQEAFERAGVSAYHLDARSPDDEREYAFQRMEDGDLRVITNVALYQEGMDCPGISCVVMARPTKSLGLWRQCGGRGLRIFTGKEDTLFLDHGGVIWENGLLDEPVDWSLDSNRKAANTKEAPKKEKKPVICRACNAVFEGVSRCPDCGTPVKSYSKAVETAEAELQEIGKVKKADMAEKRRYYGMLKYWVEEKQYNPKMVTAKYKAKFGEWPRKMDNVAGIEPDQKFLNKMKRDFIAYAKRKNPKKYKKAAQEKSREYQPWGGIAQ